MTIWDREMTVAAIMQDGLMKCRVLKHKGNRSNSGSREGEWSRSSIILLPNLI